MKCPRCGHDNPPQAKFCIECATTTYRDMGMRCWRAQADVELAELR